jgi:hypothetical protein
MQHELFRDEEAIELKHVQRRRDRHDRQRAELDCSQR